eukprot:6494619-Pyramimonas_sp.AAC.1
MAHHWSRRREEHYPSKLQRSPLPSLRTHSRTLPLRVPPPLGRYRMPSLGFAEAWPVFQTSDLQG